MIAQRITLSGQVQGVGFRPFVYRLAIQHGIVGWVRNCLGVVEIHAQGSIAGIAAFNTGLITNAPAIARPVLESATPVATEDSSAFVILASQDQGKPQISVPVDLFTCEDCLAELNAPSDRRYRYPFINCTQCGPRYTLIRRMPYDRRNTTMADFPLCLDCLAEYQNPLDRRFHAEPVACPRCGPALRFQSEDGELIEDSKAALARAVAALATGQVIAVKGIGGYHLMCDARNERAVIRLRTVKPRPDKPLAVMFPAPANTQLALLRCAVELSATEADFLSSAGRPILLLKQKSTAGLSAQIAPGLAEMGVMLPYSPLHHLLLNDFSAPLVATSANISGEPVLTDDAEVEQRLAKVADGFLHHNRPIQRPADDPVFRLIAGKPRPLRLGRGYTPLEFSLPFTLQQPVLAVGTQMKNTLTLAWGNRAVLSPHIGEMDSLRSLQVFEQSVDDLQQLYGVEIKQLVCYAHPGYTTTRWAGQQGLPVQSVFHHHAHAAACYFTADTDTAMLVFTWDGVGLGSDGTLWGGEALLGVPGDWQRVASIRPFHLPGGEKAGRQPWRSAVALCWEAGIDVANSFDIDPLIHAAWLRHLNAPETTAVGRLFDAAAALTGVCREASFEGQGPMLLEATSTLGADPISLPMQLVQGIWRSDWAPLLPVMQDTALDVATRAGIFHATLALMLLQQSRKLRETAGINSIGLAGGVFQNRLLTEAALALLEADGFTVTFPQTIPVNDAGISLGQIIEFGSSC